MLTYIVGKRLAMSTITASTATGTAKTMHSDNFTIRHFKFHLASRQACTLLVLLLMTYSDIQYIYISLYTNYSIWSPCLFVELHVHRIQCAPVYTMESLLPAGTQQLGDC